MNLPDDHISTERLFQIAKNPTTKLQSDFEEKHLEDCVECLRTLVDTMNREFKRAQKAKSR